MPVGLPPRGGVGGWYEWPSGKFPHLPGCNEGPEPSLLLWALRLHPYLSKFYAQKGQLENGPTKWKVVVK